MSTNRPEPVWTAAKVITTVSSFVTGLLGVGFIADVPYAAEAGAVVLLVCSVLAPIYGASVRERVTAHENVVGYVNGDGHYVDGPRVALGHDPLEEDLSDLPPEPAETE